MNRLRLLLAGLVLISGLALLQPSNPASAAPDSRDSVETVIHPGPGTIYDDLAAWACGASRPSSSYIVQNAVPFDIHSGAIWYSCTGHSHVTCRVSTWVSTIIIATGQVFGPINGYNSAPFC